jgi:hypothetical protein
LAAKQLLERVRQWLPTAYQRDSLDALMGLFLQATGAQPDAVLAIGRWRIPWGFRVWRGQG